MNTDLSLLNNTNIQTMTSVELVALINQHRTSNGNTTNLRHSDFMIKIRKELDDGIFNERNISLVEYLDSKGEKRPMYQLDKEASIYMVSGEIGKVRMAIIRRWTELEANQAPVAPKTQLEVLADIVNGMVRVEREQLALEKEQLRLKIEQEQQAEELAEVITKVDILSAKTSAVIDQSDYYSVMGYARLKGINLSNNVASGLSRSLGAYCKKNNIVRQEISDPRFGKVWTYPSSAIESVFRSKFIIS